jgi:hypothetical protein
MTTVTTVAKTFIENAVCFTLIMIAARVSSWSLFVLFLPVSKLSALQLSTVSPFLGAILFFSVAARCSSTIIDDSLQRDVAFTMARIMRLCGLLAGLGCLLKSSWAPVTAFQQSVPFQTTFKTKHCSFARFPPNGSSQDVDDDDRHPSSRGPDAEAILETIVPLLSPILAYLTYDFIAAGFSDVLEALANNNWESADGGAYKAKIIGPTINGIVVPAMAVLFATLTSNTISNLRLRQVDVNLAINMEASELRALECLVSAFPKGSTQDRCRSYLIHYATRIIAESQPGLSPDGANQRKGMDSEMNRFSQEIYQTYDKLPSHLANEAVGAITRLREQRQNRVTALQVSLLRVLYWRIIVCFGRFPFVVSQPFCSHLSF